MGNYYPEKYKNDCLTYLIRNPGQLFSTNQNFCFVMLQGFIFKFTCPCGPIIRVRSPSSLTIS